MGRQFKNIVYPDPLVLKYPIGEAAKHSVTDWILLNDFRVLWEDRGVEHSYKVQAGLITDRSSIPGWAQSIVHKDGPKVLAAIVHDDMYERRKELWPEWTRKEADRLLYYGCLAAGTPWFEANQMYYAVRIGGRKAWNT